jgi:hypothetical protein
MMNTVRLKTNAETGSRRFSYTLYEWTTTNIKINYLLIFLFAYTAFSKLSLFSYSAPFSWNEFRLINLTDFKEAMFKSPVLRPYIHELAYGIPVTEIIVCMLLLFSKAKKWGYYLSLILLTFFTAYIIYILNVFAHHLPCVCGGVISRMSWPQHLLFNLFFIAITIRAIFLMNKRQR